MSNRQFVLRLILWGLLIYIAVSFNVYRFRHPDLTETQLLMSIKEVLLWR